MWVFSMLLVVILKLITPLVMSTIMPNKLVTLPILVLLATILMKPLDFPVDEANARRGNRSIGTSARGLAV